MTSPTIPARPPHRLNEVPAHRTLPRLVRDPLRAFAQIGRESEGRLTRLHLGLVRPYLATHPDHVRHILCAPERYQREGMIWRPLRRLQGNGIAGEGPSWQASRRLLQPLFTTRSINALQAPMASAVTDALTELATRAAGGRPVDLVKEMTGLAHRVLIRSFFGDRIPLTVGDRLGAQIATAFQSLGWRILLPFVSDRLPLPGDRAVRRAVRAVDELIYPLIHAARAEPEQPTQRTDLIAMLAAATDEDGHPRDDRQVRDDVVAMFVAGTETTALALTWLWLLLAQHPAVADRLTEEVTAVVAGGELAAEQLPQLHYTRLVLQETLRLYPVGWVVPRTLAEPDLIDQVRLPSGATVLLSPYLTHRLASYWPDPYEFRPERFDGDTRRHRFAYIPFGAGVHQCLGSQLFLLEGQFAVAGLLSRFRPEVVGVPSLEPRATASLQPRGRPQLLLHPRR